MAKRRDSEDGIEENIVGVSVASVGFSVVSRTSVSSSGDGVESAASLARVNVERPLVSFEAARGSGGGRCSQRAWVGCMTFGYCMLLVWMSYTPSRVGRRLMERAALNVLQAVSGFRVGELD